MASTLFTALLIGIGFALSPGVSVALMFLQSAFIFWNLKRIIQQQSPYANDPVIPPHEESVSTDLFTEADTETQACSE